MLCYTQCCDVNQPLQPLVRAIPTLGRLQPPAQDTGVSPRAFPGAGWGRAGRAQGAAVLGVSCGSTQLWWGCPLPAAHGSHSPALAAPRPLHFSILHTALQTQPQKIFPWEHLIPMKHPLQASSPQNLLLPSLLDTPLQDSYSCHQTCHCLYKVPVSLL